MAYPFGPAARTCHHPRCWYSLYAFLPKASLRSPLGQTANLSMYRWLVNQGRDEEALAVLSRARRLPIKSDLVQIEFL